MSDVTPAQRRRSEDFHFGARVFSSDGRHIGSVRFVIVDRESSDVHALVVKETRRFSGHHEVVAALMEDDIAIPIAAVRDAERGQVTLSITSAEARRAAPYLTYQLAALDRGDEERVLIAEAGGGMFVPPLLEEARKRLDELEIRRGENVMLGHTGKRLGTVRDVVLDGGELAGVVVHPVGFFKEDVLLQVRFLGRSDDLALFAHLTEIDLEHLEPFHPSVDE